MTAYAFQTWVEKKNANKDAKRIMKGVIRFLIFKVYINY